ncbi:hypothetical protein [Shouchella miscanthi]|uniref:Glutathionylspermidine synthase pre-ATP-grasp-like domain-containing protein n=1 Tax=Shouchella miscanthi TaxID=2598861 RepID=A0ABU6NG16_9BACI|nr:hypothetical protein [Shouchella miscanthi]
MILAKENKKIFTEENILSSKQIIEEYLFSNELDLEGRIINVGLVPIILDKSFTRLMQEKLEKLSQINEKVISLFRTEDKVKEFFNLYSEYPQLFNKKIQSNMISISRFDIIITKDYGLKVLENNTCCPGGAFNNSFVKNAWLNTPFKDILHEKNIKQINEGNLFISTLLENYYISNTNIPTVALVNINGIYTNELKTMVKIFKDNFSIDAFVVDIKELRWDKKLNKLYYKENVITLVYNKFSPTMFLEELENHSDYVTAYQSGTISFFNSLDSIFITEDKSSLALLSDPQYHHYFKDDEISLIKEIVPWTRKLIDCKTYTFEGEKSLLIDFAVKNKNELVIKPNNKTRGQGIIFGKNINENAWKEILENRKNKGYVIQQFIELPRIKLPIIDNESTKFTWHDYYYGIESYMFNNKYQFTTSRASTTEIVNIGKEGLRLPCFSLE